MSHSRREILGLAAKLGLVPAASAFGLSACPEDPGAPEAEWPPFQGCDPTTIDWSYTGEPGPADLFAHGVASGDPLPGGVILWTRVSPDADVAVEVLWEVSESPDFATILASGLVTTDGSRDWTVKFDVDCLRPATSYYYRFQALGRTSPVGRTKTAPWGPTAAVRFATCSCSNKRAGWFHAYRAIAERDDLDVVFHLGDYFYEGGGSTEGPRAIRPGYEVITLDGYRQRYASYRDDPDLQEVHRQHPLICSMDDHESANNAWSTGAGNHDPGEGSWDDRKAAAKQAWFEWLPVREGVPGRMYRRLLYGDLLDFSILDTRLEGREPPGDDIDDVYREDRQMLGEAQEDWVIDGILDSVATWRVLAQGVVMSQWTIAEDDQGRALPVNKDQWDGYPAARQRIFEAVDATAGGFLVLTGDVHSSWAHDLSLDFGEYDRRDHRGAVGVEAVAPGVTSSFGQAGLAEALVDTLEHVVWGDGAHRGFVVLEATHEAVHADWWFFEDAVIEGPTYSPPSLGASWRSMVDEPGWVEATGPMGDVVGPEPAP